MFHHTPPTFEFWALVSPAKRVIRQIGNNITEVYPEFPNEQAICIPDALVEQERSLLKKTGFRHLAEDGKSTKNRKFLKLTPHLFSSASLLVFPEVDLQNNQFDVILELRKCEEYKVGQPISNCDVTFHKAQKQIADTQTSEYGICGVYGLSAGTYLVTFEESDVNLEIELLK
jgi:hypothetical protein